MTEKIDDIAELLRKRSKNMSRFLVAIAGPPGAGKSTLADELLEALNKQREQAAIVPMDGFHLDNAILEDRGLLARKGAPETFDADGFVSLVQRLADPAHHGDVVIPVFDRQRDLAIAGAQVVSKDICILLCEGNYLLLSKAPWNSLKSIWDQTIFINPGLEVIEQRLIERWLEHGHEPDEARSRALDNDIPNAHYVLENSSAADLNFQDW